MKQLIKWLKAKFQHVDEKTIAKHKILRAALILSAGETIGEQPDDDTLRDYLAQKINPECMEEIKSWIAYDADTFDRIIDLQEEQQLIAQIRQKKPVKAQEPWFKIPTLYWGGGLATAMAVLLLVVFIPDLTLQQQLQSQYNQLPNNIALYQKDLLWNPKNQSKGGQNETLAISFQTGLKKGFGQLQTSGNDWQQLTQQLPGQSTCTKDDCKAMQTLGEWAALQYAACQNQTEVNEAFWQQQHQLLQAISRPLITRYDVIKQLTLNSKDCKNLLALFKRYQP